MDRDKAIRAALLTAKGIKSRNSFDQGGAETGKGIPASEYVDMSWSDYLDNLVRNAPSSIANLFSDTADFADLMTNPARMREKIEFAKNLTQGTGQLAYGAGSKVARNALGYEGDPAGEAALDSAAAEIAGHYGLGQPGEFWKNLAEDPASYLGDAAAVLSGGTGATMKALKVIDDAQLRQLDEFANLYARPKQDVSTFRNRQFYEPSIDEINRMGVSLTPDEAAYWQRLSDSDTFLQRGVSPGRVADKTGILRIPRVNMEGDVLGDPKELFGATPAEMAALRPDRANYYGFKINRDVKPEYAGDTGYFLPEPGQEEIWINPNQSKEIQDVTEAHELTHADQYITGVPKGEGGTSTEKAARDRLDSLNSLDSRIRETTDPTERARLKDQFRTLRQTSPVELYYRNPGEMLANLSSGEKNMSKQLNFSQSLNPYINTNKGPLERVADAVTQVTLADTTPLITYLQRKTNFPTIYEGTHRGVPIDVSKAIVGSPFKSRGGALELARHATAVGRAGGQVSPSKYLPDVPRAVHADGGRENGDSGHIYVVHGGSDFDQIDPSYSGRGEPGGIRPLGKGLYGYILDHADPERAERAINGAKMYSRKYGSGTKTLHVYKVPKTVSTSWNGLNEFDRTNVPEYPPEIKGLGGLPEKELAEYEAHARSEEPKGDDYWPWFRKKNQLSDRVKQAADMQLQHLPIGITEAAIQNPKVATRIGKFGVDTPTSDILDVVKGDARDGNITKADGGSVTDNENFQNWFGNSVTHTDGQPHVFYTGTSKDKDFTSHNVGRHGAWFTRDPEEASQYAMVNDSQGYKRDGWNVTATNTASRVIPAYVKAENPYTGERPEKYTRDNYKAAQSEWFDTLRAQGYDSWIPARYNGDLVVALKEPQQIKSIYNNGKFDPNQKHMNKADGGSVSEEDEKANLAQWYGKGSTYQGDIWHHITDNFPMRMLENKPMWMSEDPDFTGHASLGSVKSHALHTNVKNPFQSSEKQLAELSKRVRLSDDDLKALRNPEDTDAGGTYQIIERPDVFKAIQDMGHDAAEMHENFTKNLVVFKPQGSVKSLSKTSVPSWKAERYSAQDFNRGTFDPTDNDITKADGGEVEKKRDFMRDNPGGEWLEGKRARAAQYPNDKFMIGATTGVIGGRSSMFLPTHVLKGIAGLNDEVRTAGVSKYDSLMSDAQKGGFDPEQKGNKVVVAVNHFGQPYLLEGNTRVAVAHSMGIPKVKAEVRYWNGAENVDGPMHPENVFDMASDSLDVAKATGGPVMGYVPMASLTVPRLAVARAPQYQQQAPVARFSESLNSLMDTVEGFKKKPEADAPQGMIAMPEEGYEATGMYAPFQSAIDRMIADAPGKITVSSGYRTPEEQEELWNEHAAKYPDPEVRDDYVARAGQSSHNYGLAADLSYADQEALKWAQENAPRYGLNFRMGHEDWHIEPANIWELRNAMTVPGYATGGRIGKAMLLTRGFTKDGKSAINALKLKGK